MGMLASALNEGPETRKGPPCTVGTWLSTLDPETRVEAVTMLASDDWPHAALRRAFKTAHRRFTSIR